MASVAQIQANRSNAQKSTGPRTAEGKAVASQNAVKHGLLAEQVVIHGEDPAQFDLYREGMLAELAPVGGIETMLAERAVSLAWRLRRAERLQSAVFATVYRENANDVVLWPRHGLPIEPKPDEEAVILGQVVMTDFARAQVLDRLLVHERRIENSLYRTMRELRREQEARQTAASQETSSSQNSPLTAPEPPTPTELASFGAEPKSEEVSSLKCQVSSREGRPSAESQVPGDDSDFTLQTSPFTLPPSCETNPIPTGGRALPCEEAVDASVPAGSVV